MRWTNSDAAMKLALGTINRMILSLPVCDPKVVEEAISVRNMLDYDKPLSHDVLVDLLTQAVVDYQLNYRDWS